jgi:hypothetical protein
MFSKILLATDGSDNALRAARQVVRMVKKQPAKVMMLSAAYMPSMYLDDIGPELAESFVDEARQGKSWSVKPNWFATFAPPMPFCRRPKRAITT